MFSTTYANLPWPWRDGDHSPDSIALRCKPHNLHQAELDYGKEKMERYRRSRWKDGVSEPAAVYSTEEARPWSAPSQSWWP